MSRIDDLIQELCPDGVAVRTLGSLGTRNKGTAMTASKMKTIGGGGPIRVFAGGQTVADVAEDAIPAKDVVRVPSIIVKSRGHIGFSYYERPFTHKTELWSYSIDAAGVDQKFVHYYLLTQVGKLQALARATSVKLPQLSVRDTDTLGVPVPPLEVQREIVRVLDKFTQLEAELEAELEARRVQYEHYRRELLSGGEAASGRIIPLGEIFEMRAGTHIKAAEISDEPTEEKPYPCYGGNGLRGYVSSYNYDESVIFVGRQGALCGNVHRAEGKIYATEHAVVVTPKVAVDMSWAFHKLTEMDLNQYKTKSAQPGLAVGRVKQVEAQYVPIVDQRRHGEVLDKLDTLVSDISIGLPAELGARREQYEYYRDRLLTFKELTS